MLSLAAARTLISAALAKSADAGFKPLTVAVLDAGGHLVALERQDGSSILRPEIAIGKAFGCLAVGQGSRWLDANAKTRPHFVDALNGAAGGKIIPVAGGVLIKSQDGTVVGAVGVTGDTSDNDEIAALAGVEAAGLVGETGA